MPPFLTWREKRKSVYLKVCIIAKSLLKRQSRRSVQLTQVVGNCHEAVRRLYNRHLERFDALIISILWVVAIVALCEPVHLQNDLKKIERPGK